MLLVPFVEFASANPFHNYIGPPKVTLHLPVTDYVYNQSGTPFSAKVEMYSHIISFFPRMHEELEELAWIKYSLDGQPNVTVTVKKEVTNQHRGTIEAEYGGNIAGMVSGISMGAHKLTIYGGTRLTNHTETLNNFNVSTYFVVNNVNPTIQVLSPQQKTYSSPSVSLEFKNDKALSWEGYSLDQNPVVPFHNSRTNMNLFNGNHTLRIYGEDTQGNICASQSVAFMVNTRKPPIVNIHAGGLISNFSSVTYFHLSFNVSQPTSWMGYILDGGGIQTANGTGVIIKTTYGTHTVTAYARDLCGNSGVSDPFTITLTKPESVPHASLFFPDMFGAPTPTPNNTDLPNPTTATPKPLPSNTINQQPQQGTLTITLIAVTAGLIAFVSLICLFLLKRSPQKK